MFLFALTEASKASIDFLALHDLLLQELKKPATDLSNRLMELLDLLNGRKDTISLSELKRFLGIRAANRQAPAIPLEELRHKLLDPTRLQRLLNDGAFGPNFLGRGRPECRLLDLGVCPVGRLSQVRSPLKRSPRLERHAQCQHPWLLQMGYTCSFRGASMILRSRDT